MRHTKNDCNGVHCKCIDSECDNFHYSDHISEIGELNKCEHNWQIVLSITSSDWSEFVKNRDNTSLPLFTYSMTHTLICSMCKSIKKVDEKNI